MRGCDGPTQLDLQPIDFLLAYSRGGCACGRPPDGCVIVGRAGEPGMPSTQVS